MSAFPFMNRTVQTDYLTATSGFLVGMGSVLNLRGNYFDFNESDSPEEADRLARNVDGWMVAQDLAAALRNLVASGKSK